MHLIGTMFKIYLSYMNKLKYRVLWLQSQISVNTLLYWDDDSLLNQTDCTFSLRDIVLWSHGHMEVSTF